MYNKEIAEILQHSLKIVSISNFILKKKSAKLFDQAMLITILNQHCLVK